MPFSDIELDGMGDGRTEGIGKSEAEEDVVDAVVHVETPQGKPLLLLLSERGGASIEGVMES